MRRLVLACTVVMPACSASRLPPSELPGSVENSSQPSIAPMALAEAEPQAPAGSETGEGSPTPERIAAILEPEEEIEDIWGSMAGSTSSAVAGGVIGGSSASGGGGFGRRSAGQSGLSSRVRHGSHSVAGALDPDLIRRIVRAHVGEVRTCYSRGLIRDATLGGRIEIAFTIGSDGRVTQTRIEANQLADADVADCISKSIRNWRFPKPKGGGIVEVRYPFVLQPG